MEPKPIVKPLGMTLRGTPPQCKAASVIVLLGMLMANCALQGGTVPLARRLPAVTVTCIVLTPEDAPIPGARCQSEGVGATTDDHGVAVLRGVPSGDRLVVVTAPGYTSGSQPCTVSATDLTVTVHLRAGPSRADQ